MTNGAQTDMIKTYHLENEAETMACGATMAERCHAPCVIYLSGELGAGKTTFVRGFLRRFGYEEPVKSPSYSVVESYELANGIIIHHVDLYRLNGPAELDYIGLDECFSATAICLIEWPERAEGKLPASQFHCQFRTRGDGREVRICCTALK